MKERFYAGLALAKDLQFCAYMDELRANPEVLIIREGERALVHEMEYKDDERIDTGRTHEGYVSHYVTFLFRNAVFYMQAGTHYPFTDENESGLFNFIPYRLIGPSQKMQMDYFLPYEGIASLRVPAVSQVRGSRLSGTDYGVGLLMERQIANLVRTHGGIREKSIWNDGHNCIMLQGHTWNAEHKVVQVVSLTVDEAGHRDSFDVDVVCGKFCG